jgi:hypothetical protein
MAGIKDKVKEVVKKVLPNPTMIMPSKEYEAIQELEREDREKEKSRRQESGEDYPADWHKKG